MVSIPRAQPHAQSLFLFPIVFGVNVYIISRGRVNIGQYFLSLHIGRVYKLTETAGQGQYFEGNMMAEADEADGNNMLISGILTEQWCGSRSRVFLKVRTLTWCATCTDITVIAEIFVRVKVSYSSVCRLSYARNFRTATMVSDTLVYVYGFRMVLNFVLSAKSTKYTKLNRVRKFVR